MSSTVVEEQLPLGALNDHQLAFKFRPLSLRARSQSSIKILPPWTTTPTALGFTHDVGPTVDRVFDFA
jgi:hypothetical protein